MRLLIAYIKKFLLEPNCRFVLLVAPPGAGKTAFTAGLAARYPNWIRYFLRRDQIQQESDIGAKSLLLRIGYQMAALYPELFKPNELQLVVKQRIGTATLGSETVDAEVERLLASPFYELGLKISQQVGLDAGSISGLHVKQLMAEPRLMSVSDLQYLALLDAASMLTVIDPNQRLVVLVDALDELRFHNDHDTLLDWLSDCPELPSNVRFVLTSRPDDKLLGIFRKRQEPWLRELTIDPKSNEVRNDVYQYAAYRASAERIELAVAGHGLRLEEFLQAVVASATGNLGYVANLFRDIELARQRYDYQHLALLLQLEALPSGLEQLYAFFLHQIKEGATLSHVELTDPKTGKTLYVPAWPAVYLCILGVLAVAREPLTLSQMMEYGYIQAKTGDVAEALAHLSQFMISSENRYRLYHQSLADFLTSARTGEHPDTADLFVDPVRWHSIIYSSILAKVGL